MICPECKGRLMRKRMGVFAGFLGAIGLELAFWIIVGMVAIFIQMYVGFIAILVIACIIIISLAFYLDRKYSVLKCESCGGRFARSDLDKRVIQINQGDSK